MGAKDVLNRFLGHVTAKRVNAASFMASLPGAPGSTMESRQPLSPLKSSKAPTNYFTPNILRKSWSRLVVSVVHLDALAFPVAAT